MAKYKIEWDSQFRRFYAYDENGELVSDSSGYSVKARTLEECEALLRDAVANKSVPPPITEKWVEL